MEVRSDSRNGVTIASSTDTITALQAKTQACKDQWAQELREDPNRLADIEQQIGQHYRRGGGQLKASLLAEVTNDRGWRSMRNKCGNTRPLTAARSFP